MNSSGLSVEFTRSLRATGLVPRFLNIFSLISLSEGKPTLSK
jgi:hypothetical protein